jgi:hypothetical protein
MTSTDLAQALHASPAGAIWLAAGTRHRRRLIDLTADHPALT